MNLVEVVILVGAQCLSPMEVAPGLTEVRKVPCAVLVRQDPKTDDIEFVPPAAATDPAVIAMLVRPRGTDDLSPKADRQPLAAADITGSVTPAPRVVAAADLAEALAKSAKPRVKKPVVPGRRAKAARRSDVCGAARPVWYTNKNGYRKYRCVKSG